MSKAIRYIEPLEDLRMRDFYLVRDVIDGNEDAWNTLYQEAFPFVTQAARQADYHKLMSTSDYAEAVSEAFKRCFEQLYRYRGQGRFRSWVSGYVRNVVRNQSTRIITAHRNAFLLRLRAQSQVAGSDPLMILIYLERDRCLWQAFYDLPAVEQDIVIFRVFYQVSYQKIAKKYNLTRKQVSQKYNDVIFKLRWNFLRLYYGYFHG